MIQADGPTNTRLFALGLASLVAVDSDLRVATPGRTSIAAGAVLDLGGGFGCAVVLARVGDLAGAVVCTSGESDRSFFGPK